MRTKVRLKFKSNKQAASKRASLKACLFAFPSVTGWSKAAACIAFDEASSRIGFWLRVHQSSMCNNKPKCVPIFGRQAAAAAMALKQRSQLSGLEPFWLATVGRSEQMLPLVTSTVVAPTIAPPTDRSIDRAREK